MISLKDFAKNILNSSSETISVGRDLLGYSYRFQQPSSRIPSAPHLRPTIIEISLLDYVKLLMDSPVININIVKVGSESFDSEDSMIDHSLYSLRKIFSKYQLGIARVKRHFLPSDESLGLEHIGSKDDYTALTNLWNEGSSIDAIDVFFVKTYSLGGGHSIVNGPCDPNGFQHGCIISLIGLNPFADLTMAHEIAHYLSLPHHPSDPANLMYEGGSPSFDAQLEPWQVSQMKSHCKIQPPIELG